MYVVVENTAIHKEIVEKEEKSETMRTSHLGSQPW